MREAFRLHLEQSQLLGEGQRVLVGYSGGPDSTCLLDLLHACGVDVAAGHLHHGQRQEADDEQKRCEDFCESKGIPILCGRADVPLMSRTLGIGLEEAGRHARYAFFRQAAGALGCGITATAHTKDDLVETVILNLARGTGLAGAAGIPSSRDGIIRPLLPFTRAETRAYCESRAYWFHDDPANTDLVHSRARIRARVLPELAHLNPDFMDAIRGFADQARAEDSFLNGMAAAALEKAEIPLNGPFRFLTSECEASFSRMELAVLPPVLLARSLRLAAAFLGAGLDRRQTEVIAAGMTGGTSGSITCEEGRVALEWDEERLSARELNPPGLARTGLECPGETLGEGFGWKFTTSQTRGLDPRQERGAFRAILRAGAVKGGLYIRSASPGDHIQPLGMTGRKLVNDILGEMDLSRTAKARVPIVCDMIGPIWVPGGPIDERVKVLSPSEPQLDLRFDQI